MAALTSTTRGESFQLNNLAGLQSRVVGDDEELNTKVPGKGKDELCHTLCIALVQAPERLIKS